MSLLESSGSANYVSATEESDISGVFPSPHAFIIGKGQESEPALKAEVMTKSLAILVLAVLITSPASAQSVQLTWTQSVTVGVTSNNILRGTAEGGPYSPIHSSSTPIVSYTDTNVTIDGYYCYVVTALAHGRESKHSNESCVKVTTKLPTVVKAK